MADPTLPVSTGLRAKRARPLANKTKARRLERAAALRQQADDVGQSFVPAMAQADALRDEATDAVWQAMQQALWAFGLAFDRDDRRDTAHPSGFCFSEAGAQVLLVACRDVVKAIYAQPVVASCEAIAKRAAAIRAHAARLDDTLQRCLRQAHRDAR